MNPEIRAAGGVVLRRRGARLETLLVYRARYDDWSLPKGKSLDDESDADTARREVGEETGLDCEVGPELPSTCYVDSAGRTKSVRYWLMVPRTDAGSAGDHEIDEIRWLEAVEAERALTHPRDVPVLAAARSLAEPLYLVRHGKAGSRARWRGDDRVRPLTGKGRRQAFGLIGAMEGRPISRVLSSGFDRCVQSVEPLATDRGLSVEPVSWLEEGADTSEMLRLLTGLPGPAVLCSHGDVIPAVIGALADAGTPIDGSVAWKKGSTWIVERDIGVPSALRYEPPPRDRAPRT